MSVRVIACKAGAGVIACLETNFLDQWFYEDIYINVNLRTKVHQYFNEDFLIEDYLEEDVDPSPEHVFTVREKIGLLMKESLEETVVISDLLMLGIGQFFDEDFTITDTHKSAFDVNFGPSNYSLGSIELGSRELNPGPIGEGEEEFLVTEELVMVITPI